MSDQIFAVFQCITCRKNIHCVRLLLSVTLTNSAVLIPANNFPFTMPVEWQAPSMVSGLSPTLSDWLLNTGSLTERLQALTNSFELELLGQNAEALDISETQQLQNSSNQEWQVREVLLKGHKLHSEKAADWVFARSVLPDELCKSTWANLGKQPLGQRIFNDAEFVRSQFEIGQLRYHPITKQPFESNTYWARRSTFKIDKYELLVAEAFLPDSPCYW